MFVTPYHVRFADVDNAGIFYYPRFFHAFHVAFEEWWDRGAGRPYHKVIQEDKIGFPAVHIDTDFRIPVTFGDPVDIHVGMEKLGRTSAVFRFAFVHRESGATHCVARITNVCVDMDTFSPVEPPQAIKDALEKIRITDADSDADQK